jgi:hypothetical protein
VCVFCGLRLYHFFGPAVILFPVKQTHDWSNGHTISIWSLNHVYSPLPTSKMKRCTVVLGSLGRNMLHSVHSMQKYCTIILIGCIWCQSGLVQTSAISCRVSVPLRVTQGARTAPCHVTWHAPEIWGSHSGATDTVSLDMWFLASRRQANGPRRLCWRPSTDSRTAASLWLSHFSTCPSPTSHLATVIRMF